MNRAVVALGSNIDAEANMGRALMALATEFELVASSTVTRTKPVGPVVQDDFLNSVALVTTQMDAERLRIKLKDIERHLGRQIRADKWGPREIDLDLLIWNGQVVNKDYFERDFLQKAVAEILPNMKTRCC